MPIRKRMILGAALAAGAALLAASALLAAGGRTGEGAALLAITLVLGIAAAQVLWARFDVTGRSLRRGSRRSHAVALTFDDGPGPDTPAVLDALDAAGVRATFFVLGAAARRAPELVRAAAARGHEVALHGDTHAKLGFAGPARIAAEIDRCREAVRAAGVEPAPLFRAPHGWKGPLLSRALERRGLTLVGWSRGVFDTARPGAAAIAARATRRPRGGEILLLHDGCGAAFHPPAHPEPVEGRREQTAAAVPEIVARWRAAGYEFVPVSELGRRRGGGAGRWARLRRLLVPEDGQGTARRRALRISGLAVVAVFAALAALSVDLGAVGGALAGADPRLVVGAMAANLLSLAAHTGRWTALVPRAGGRPRFRDAFSAITAGFAVSIVVPARAGDVVRAWIVARRTGTSTATGVGVTGLDYLVAGATLVPVLALLALAAPVPAWARHALLVFAAVSIAGLGAALLLRPRARAPGAAPAHRAGRFVARLRAGLAATGDPRALATAGAWGVAGWCAELLIGHLALAALGLPADAVHAALVVLAATAGGIVAVSPGAAGPFELAIVLALVGSGVSREAALAAALLYHVVHLAPVAVLGSFALVRELRAEPA